MLAYLTSRLCGELSESTLPPRDFEYWLSIWSYSPPTSIRMLALWVCVAIWLFAVYRFLCTTADRCCWAIIRMCDDCLRLPRAPLFAIIWLFFVAEWMLGFAEAGIIWPVTPDCVMYTMF